MKLNLQANNEAEKRVLEYLENNISETLANKINAGVQVEKDGKQLLSKKDLNSFFVYAQNEARKIANNNQYACIEDATVFGWAIHYFEEDTIEGKMFNLDGTEYKVQKPIKKETPKVEVKEKPKQPTLFDFMTESSKPKEESEPDPIFDDVIEDIPTIKEIEGRKVDTSTGEIISTDKQTFDKDILKEISVVFDGKIKIE